MQAATGRVYGTMRPSHHVLETKEIHVGDLFKVYNRMKGVPVAAGQVRLVVKAAYLHGA